MDLPIFDTDDALARVEGDQELLRELVALFLQDYPGYLDKLEAAIEANQPHSVERLAHSLKSALVNLSAQRAAAAASRLETIGRSTDLGLATESLQHLEEELVLLQQTMEVLLYPTPG